MATFVTSSLRTIPTSQAASGASQKQVSNRESPPPPLPARPVMTCTLCGNVGSVVACEDCSSMTFCSSCDDMYHRHPKRKFHLRKSVAHPPPVITASNWNQANNMNGSSKPPQIPGPRVVMTNFPAVDAGHPSKMPIPPPRRKKSLRSLSSLDGEMFGSNGSVNSVNHNTGTLPPRLPPIGPSVSAQTQVMYTSNFPRRDDNTMVNMASNRTYGPTQAAVSYSSGTDLSQSEQPYIDPVILSGSARRGSRSSSLSRRNTSLQDLRNVYDPMMYQQPAPPPFMQHPAYGYNPYANPYGYPGAPPMNPWDYQSVDMEDGESSEDEEVDEEASSEMASNSNRGSSKGQNYKNRTLRGNRRPETMGRSYSSYQLPVWPGGPPPPPPPNPYYGYGPNYGAYAPHPYYSQPQPPFYGTSSFASSSPPGSLQSLNNLPGMRRKKSLDQLSTTSSRRDDGHHGQRRSRRSAEKRRETSTDRSNFPRTLQDHRSNRRNGSKPGSISGRSVASSRYESESDYEDEEIYSDEEEVKSNARGGEDKKSEVRRRKIGDRIRGSLEKLISKGAQLMTTDQSAKKWSCKHCTYVNQADKDICDICFKSNPNKLKGKNSGQSKERRKNSSDSSSSQVAKQISHEFKNKKLSIGENLQVSDELVREQLEIEKELKRRRENEERIAEENKRVEEREKRLKEKMNEPPNLESQDTNSDEQPVDAIAEIANDEDSNDEEEEEEEISESLVKLDQDKNRYQRRPSPKKSISSRHSQTRDKSSRSHSSPTQRKSKDKDGESLNRKRDKSYERSRHGSRKQVESDGDEEEDEVDKEMKAIESLISSLAQQKLDIEKIEKFISTAAVNVSNSKNPEQPVAQQSVITNAPIPQQLTAMGPVHNQFQQLAMAQAMAPGPSMIPIQNFQPSFYDQLMHRPSVDSVMNSFNSCLMEPPLPPRMASLRNFNGSTDNVRGNYPRYGSSDDVSSSGVGMIKLLREAEKKGFSADDVEVALNFSPSDPIEWLDNNWMSMIETVLRFANNQLIKNGQKSGKGNIGKLNLVQEKDAKIMLRKSKGDIWQAVEKCIQRKEEEEKVGQSKNSNGEKSKDFTLKHNGIGQGRDNHEMNQGEIDFDVENCDEDIDCEKIMDPNICLFHPDDSDEEGDEELINLFIEKWKYEKEQEMMQLKERPADDDCDRKLFDSDMFKEIDCPRNEKVGENSTAENYQDMSSKEQLREKKEKAREKFFSSLEEIDSIATNGPETGKDLRKYLFNKYFGDDNSDEESKTDRSIDKARINSGQVPSTSQAIPCSEQNGARLKTGRTSLEMKKEPLGEAGCSKTESDANSSDEYEYVEVEEYDEEDVAIPDLKESRRAFFGGKNLDEYVSDQDGIAATPEGLLVNIEEDPDVGQADVEKREIDTSNLGNTFEFLMSLNVDDLDADGTIEELMKISDGVKDDRDKKEQSPEILTMKLRPTDVALMSRSESPRFIVEPDIEENAIKIIPKRSILSRNTSPLPAGGQYNSLTNLIIDPDQKYYECELCAAEKVPVTDMITMLACEHQACKDCIKQYLTLQIRERPNIIIPCPFCREPDLSANDEEGIWNFVSLFDVLIRSLLPSDVHELYQRKIRDRALMKDPSFRWCPSCSSGFIAGNLCAVTVMCPDCQTVTCIKCNRIWEPQHAEISCEAFLEWKRSNDPSFSLEKLDYHLKLFGIDCPNCRFHYELSKGGCMHFHCVQCEYDFCGGCRSQFVPGSSCKGSKYCEKLGLHAHHPRNCLFYLRDKDPDVLMKLLDCNGVIYNKSPSIVSKGKPCPVMEQKRSSLGFKDESCGRLVEFSGFCRNHYIEYLGQLIMKHRIDPIEILEEYELEMVLKRNNFALPEKVDYNYKQSLVETIKLKCPLNIET